MTEKYFDDIFDTVFKRIVAWTILLSEWFSRNEIRPFFLPENQKKTSIVINAPQLQDVFLISEPINDSCSDPKLPNWDSNLITEFNLTCEREELVSTPDLYYNTGAALSCLFCFFLDSYEVNSPSSLNVKPF